LDAVNVSSVALMAVVTFQLGVATLSKPVAPFINYPALVIAAIAAILTIRFQVNAAWLVLGGALMSFLFFLLGFAN
jgi:chromate transporter